MTIYNKNRYVRNTKKDTYLHTICVKRNKKDYKNDIFSTKTISLKILLYLCNKSIMIEQ